MRVCALVWVVVAACGDNSTAPVPSTLSAGPVTINTAATGGKTLSEMANKLLQSVDPDKIAEKAAQKSGVEAHEVSPEALAQAPESVAHGLGVNVQRRRDLRHPALMIEPGEQCFAQAPA